MLFKEHTPARGPRITGVLDIGTNKACCLIVRLDRRGEPTVIGFGHQLSRGIKAGVITDLDEAEQSVRAAVGQAERAADTTLDEVMVAVSCGRLKSQKFTAKADIADGVVTANDIERATAGGQAYAERDGRTLIHMNRLGFKLDGVPGGRDPRGLAARQIAVELHAVTADVAPIRNLLLVLEKCYLGVSGLIAAPYASALAATTPEERKLGVTCIDIGGGVSTIASFAEGRFVSTDAVMVGGNHITFDIARALQTPLAQAERIKALYGTLVGAQSDELEAFSYPLAGEEPGVSYQTTKSRLAQVIRPRVESLFSHLSERLERGRVTRHSADHVVLTGGTSQLVGIAEFAANALGRPVRVGHPGQSFAGQGTALPPALSNPAFSTLVGLVAAGTAGGLEPLTYRDQVAEQSGYLGRFGQWLREGF